MTPNVAVRPVSVGTRRRVRLSRRHLGRSLVIYVSLAAFAAWVLLPLWFTAMSSISQPAEMVARPPHWIPQSPTLENYEAVFGTASKARNSSEQNARIVTSLGWSLIIGITVAALNLLIGGLAAYGYSRFRFRGSRSGYVFLLVSRVVPAIAIITPFFIAFRVTGLINTPFALIFSYFLFTLPLSIWLLRSYFDALSPEIEEAAMVDGASRLRILWIIVAPLAAPGLIATALLVFLEAWSEFFYANVLTSQLTVPPLLASYNSLQTFSWNTLAAATVLSLVPPVLIAIIFQRYVVSGLSHGALK
jgi:ABC-type glycerol-3-phosphate transport system permease component